MIKIGKKGKAWNNTRRKLKDEFFNNGIIRCEIKLPGCWGDNALGFAHTAKRRNLDDLKSVVLACTECHQKVEYQSLKWTGQTMTEYLEGIIARRGLNLP